MKKIAINVKYGGFGLSDEALILYAQKKGLTLYRYYIPSVREKIYHKVDLHFLGDESGWHTMFSTKDCGPTATSQELEWFDTYNIERDDSDLIAVIEQLGESANGRSACLKIVEIPDDVQWRIEDYDGLEHIAEIHRTWH